MASPQLLKIPMPSDAIQTSQLRCFWRSQIRGPRQAATTNRLLQRALRHQSNFTDNHQAANTLAPPAGPNDLWAKSIAKIYSDTGLAISQPPAPSNTHLSLLTTYPDLHQQAQHLHDHALYLPGDLHTGQHWIPVEQLPMALQPHLQPLLQGPAQPPPPRPIHAGQF